jgi:cytochrome bd-type quinol oxidase subunit 2
MTLSLDDLTPGFFIFLSVALLLAVAAVGAFVLSSHKRRETTRKRALWTAAVASALVAFFATSGFAIPALEDFHNPGVRFRDALIGNLIVWAICSSAWVIAVRCIIFASRKNPAR